MQKIPIIAAPNQTFSITLGGQQCRITVRQKSTGVYLDLVANNVAIVTTAICRDRVALVRNAYRPFTGNLAFVDTQGTTDPQYSGFGARYQLVYTP